VFSFTLRQLYHGKKADDTYRVRNRVLSRTSLENVRKRNRPSRRKLRPQFRGLVAYKRAATDRTVLGHSSRPLCDGYFSALHAPTDTGFFGWHAPGYFQASIPQCAFVWPWKTAVSFPTKRRTLVSRVTSVGTVSKYGLQCQEVGVRIPARPSIGTYPDVGAVITSGHER
jgi:hypothetical protein